MVAANRLIAAIRSPGFWASLLIFAMLFWLLQWAPAMPHPTLDWSWNQVLMHAAEAGSGVQFGPDIAFVYGPLGFAQSWLYTPAAYLWAIAIRAFVLVLLGLFYFKILRRVSFVIALPLAVTIVAAATCSLEAALGSASVVVILTLSEADAGLVDFAGLALMCGAVALMKFPYFIALGATYSMTALYRAFRWREYPLPILLWALVLVLGYLLIGQHLTSFPEYVRSSLSYAGGHGEAMQTFGPLLETLRFCSLAGALLVIFGLNAYRRDGGWTIFLVGALAVVVIVIFKDGFVHHDEGHQGVAVPLLFTTTALCVAWMSRRGVDPAGLGLFVVSAAVFFLTFVPGRLGVLKVTNRNIHAIGNLAENGTRRLDERYDQALEAIHSAWPLPKVAGYTDVYPFDQTILFASGNRYRPRPAFQSTTAYTPYLIERNVEFLRSRSAPDTIFFRIEPFDGRLPAFEDGASWPELLSRYDITDDIAGFLRLDRRRAARGYSFSPFLKETVNLGENVKIDNPDNALLWGHIELEKTTVGKIAGMLLKMPLLRLDVVLRDGTSRSFRILPAAAAEGFLLSPLVDSRLDFVALNLADSATLMAVKQVSQIAISPQRFAAAAYRAEVPIVIEKLQWAGNPRAVGSKLDGEARGAEGLAILNAGQKEGICQLDFSGQDPEMFAHAASRITINAPTARQLTVRFGIRDGAWKDGNHTDGVEFRISAVGVSGTPQIVWSRRLTPVQRIDDRGDQQAQVNLLSNPGERLIFETLPIPGGTTNWAWSYWKSLEFSN